MELITDMKVVTIMDNDLKDDISVKIENETLTIRINPFRVFTNLYNKEVILGALNGELNRLLKDHLKAQSEKEDYYLNEVQNGNGKRNKQS